MATYARNGWQLMTAMPYYDEKTKQVVYPSPVEPQPNTFDDRPSPDGHLGLAVMSPDGKAIRQFDPAGMADMLPKAWRG